MLPTHQTHEFAHTTLPSEPHFPLLKKMDTLIPALLTWDGVWLKSVGEHTCRPYLQRVFFQRGNLILCSYLLMLQPEIVNQIIPASPEGQTQSCALCFEGVGMVY